MKVLRMDLKMAGVSLCHQSHLSLASRQKEPHGWSTMEQHIRQEGIKDAEGVEDGCRESINKPTKDGIKDVDGGLLGVTLGIEEDSVGGCSDGVKLLVPRQLCPRRH
jgi:hypothetical protein